MHIYICTHKDFILVIVPLVAVIVILILSIRKLSFGEGGCYDRHTGTRTWDFDPIECHHTACKYSFKKGLIRAARLGFGDAGKASQRLWHHQKP